MAAAIIAVIAGFIFQISKLEWLAIVFAIGLVFILEIINTAIEHLANFMSPDKHDAIKKIKDLAAAAVLIAAITAFIIGLIIFLPKMIS